MMSDAICEVQFWDNTWRTYARGIPNEPVFVNRCRSALAHL
jgi:hypothetical protein